LARVLLIDALARGRGGRYASLDVVGVGPRLVAGILEHHGVKVDVRVYDAVARDPRILGEYGVLMVSGMTVDKPGIRRIAEWWARYNGGLSLIGGPVAIEYEEMLRYGYNIAVVGEAEIQLACLAPFITKGKMPEWEYLNNICGLAFKQDSKSIYTGKCSPTPRSVLNKYKASARHAESYENYWALRFYVEVVRGCSNFYRTFMKLPDGRKCILCDICRSGALKARITCPLHIPAGCGYCGVPELYGPPRSRDAGVVAEEIRELVNHGVSRIVLSAPDILDYGRDLLVEPEPLTDPREPPANLEALEKLFEEIYSRVHEALEGEVIISAENIKANLVTEDVAKLLGRYLAGTTIHIGVETGDEHHALMLGRPSTPSEALRAVSLLHKYGLRPYVYFIHGLPGQTMNTARKTVSLMRRMWREGVEKITVYRFTPLPGTAFQDMPPGKPAYMDKASLLIVREASRINRLAKRKMVGRKLLVIVAGKYKGRLLAYPFRHGPVVILENGRSKLIGRKAVVIITGIEERLVRGRVITVLGKAVKHHGKRFKKP